MANLIWYNVRKIKHNGIGTANYTYSLAGWQLVYVAISVAIGLGNGLLTGILNLCDKDYGLASNSCMFETDFGLLPLPALAYGVPEPAFIGASRTPEVNLDSQQQLNAQVCMANE